MTTAQGQSASGDPVHAVVPDVLGAPSVEALCLQLGWSMQRLYRARPCRQAEPDQLPDRLPGLSRLTRLNRVEIDLGRAQACLSGIADALNCTGNHHPGVGEIRKHLDVFRGPEDAGRARASGSFVTAYRKAVLDCHLSLLTTITAAGAKVGKAYNLGRALADTGRPGQDEAALRQGFDPHRLAQLQHDLDDLVSVLPAHAAKSVGQSLTWWRDAVYLADDSATGRERRASLGGVRTDAPEFRRRRCIPNPKISKAASAGSLDSLRLALPRQGELWRVVLTGEKNALDLLTPADYLDAAQRAVAGGRRIAARTFLAAPKTTIGLFLLVTAVLAGVLAVVEDSHASNGAKLAAFLVVLGGYLGSLARAGMPRLTSAARVVEQPLWQTALDVVTAEAISLPPVGRPDASGSSLLPGIGAELPAD
jgi:hypothetical protein